MSDEMNDEVNDEVNDEANDATSEAAAQPTSGDRPGGLHPLIFVCADGPLLVRGSVDIVGADGAPVHLTRKTIALCRCGESTIKPFCDGSHKLVGFHPDQPPAN